MKKAILYVICLIFVFGLCACDKANITDDSFTADGELQKATDVKGINMLTSTDDFERQMQVSGGDKTDKSRYVGLFYFLWSGQYQTDKVRDINKMLYDGDDSFWTSQDSQSFHHWGEPLLGYYNSRDPWVIRKHIELLTLADVDFLVFDTTNSCMYYDVLDVMLPIMQEYFLAGWDVPKIVFYTNANSARMIRALYYGNADSSISDSTSMSALNKEGIYKAGKYKDLWFCPNGKPLIIGITPNNGGASDQIKWQVGLPASEITLNPTTDAEILNFFEIKESQWPTTGYANPNGFPWIEFTPSPTPHGETVNVSISQHNLLPFSDALISSEVAEKMWGRGWHDGKADHSNKAIFSGANFEERYSKAIDLDPKYTFVTGWNEWVAQKQYGANNQNTQYGVPKTRASFVDTVNTEYSRDAEMMKGGYFDNYYLSLARNNRKLKGSPFTPVYQPNKTINIHSGMTQWNNGASSYADFVGESPERDYVGHATNIHYTAPAASNDISGARVASDSDNIYFLVEFVNKIEANQKLPQLYLATGSSTGYKGYNYSVTLAGGVATVNQLSGDVKLAQTAKGSGWYTKGDKYAQIKVPKSCLGISGKFSISFKVAIDASITNVESFYNIGDVCPAGRLNYAYYGEQ